MLQDLGCNLAAVECHAQTYGNVLLELKLLEVGHVVVEAATVCELLIEHLLGLIGLASLLLHAYAAEQTGIVGHALL